MVRVYLGDGDVGAYGSGSRVPDDELATRLNLYPPGFTTADIRRAISPTLHDVGEESIAARQRLAVMAMLQELHGPRGWVGIVTAEDGTFVYGNTRGGSSVPMASRAGTYVSLAPGVDAYMAAAGAGGRGPIQPLLQPYYPVGALGTRAPRSSQDGVARDWALTVADAFFVGNGEAPLLGGGALTVTDVFPARDGGTPYFARGALPVADVFPEIGGGTPYLARGALIPSIGDGGGGNARNQHVFVDMPPSPPDATTGTTDRARKFLERLLFGLLPASVVALGPLTGAPDGTKLAIYIIMAVLIVLLVIGISTRAYAAHVVRLATCAGIFAMTLLVSIQFSRGIYVAIAAIVGVALTGLTLAL